MLANTPVTTNTSGLAYGASWASIFSLEFEPQVWQEWYQKYGKGFGFFDFLTIAGQSVSVKADSITAFTDVAQERPVKLGAVIATAGHTAGTERDMTLDATEYPSGNLSVLRAGDSVYINPAYTNKDVPTKWLVKSVGAYNSGSPTASKIQPYDSTVVVTVNVPSASYLMVGPNNSGRGGGQPGPRSSGATSATFYTAITESTGEIVGGLNAIQTYRQKNGQGSLFSKMQVETEFDHSAGMDKELFLGQVNSNSLATAAYGSTTSTTKGTKGIWNHVNESGMSLPYATDFSVDHFDQIKEYLRSQGVTDTEVAFLVGSNLLKNIENNVLGFVKEYSGGTDLTNGMGTVGAQVKRFLKNGITTTLAEIVSFDNANSYGVLDNYFKNSGLIIPMSLATVKSEGIGESAGQKVKIPNVSIGYLNNNGENRERMIGLVAGMNGMGLPVNDAWDRTNFYIKSEYMLVANLVNQMIKVTKTGTY